MASHQVPPSLHEKFTLLRYFAQYMDDLLWQLSDLSRHEDDDKKQVENEEDRLLSVSRTRQLL